jgi:hypothetical protein
MQQQRPGPNSEMEGNSMSKLQHVITFGSISSGTMLPEDLIPCFASELASILREQGAEANKEHVALVREADALEDYEGEEADYILDDLFTALDEYAPAFGYFGAHPGDGADYGYWLSEDWEQCAIDMGAIKVNDLADVPDDQIGEVIQVSDHGNVTLYCYDQSGAPGTGHWREIWSVV